MKEAIPLLALCLGGCGETHNLLGTEEYTNQFGAEILQGYGCVGTEPGDGMGAGTASPPTEGAAATPPQVSFEYQGTGETVHFVVKDESGLTLAERTYDFDFLDKEMHDEVIVELAGVRHRFEHRGESSCNGPWPDDASSNGVTTK